MHGGSSEQVREGQSVSQRTIRARYAAYSECSHKNGCSEGRSELHGELDESWKVMRGRNE